MRNFVVALTLAGSLALPGLASAMDDMTCADFTAMDSKGQMETVGMMQHSEGGMAAGDNMAAGGTMAAGDNMAAGDGMMASHDETMTVTTACDDHPDMMLGDAMKTGN